MLMVMMVSVAAVGQDSSSPVSGMSPGVYLEICQYRKMGGNKDKAKKKNI